MTRIIRLYGQFLRSWLTVVVYLWTLELFAVFAMGDPEPLLDRLADCSAILWTLAFWTASAVVALWSAALISNRMKLLVLSDRCVKVALVLVTAICFVRWVFNWTMFFNNPDAVLYVLIPICLILGVSVWLRRKNRSQRELSVLSLSDGWNYFALPVLLVTFIILAVKVGENVTVLSANRAVVRRAAAPKGAQPRPNVVLIVADALRAQNMSLYGYRKKTTPFLDRFAEKSHVYSQMYTNSTSTRPSLTSILSGKHPFSHGRLTKFLPAYENPENLAALLRDNGYTTAAVTSHVDATFHSLGLAKYLVHGEYPNFRRLTLSWLRDNGVYPTSSGIRVYDELSQIFPFLGFPEKTLSHGQADDALQRAARLAAELPEPYFLFVHVFEPHSPYQAPLPFRGKYAKLDYREVDEKISSQYYRRYQPELQPFVDAHRDHYDEAIEYLDSELAQFVQALERSPKTRNSLLIVTSDHGESFERGFLNHGEDLYESSVHIPLIIKMPNQQTSLRSPVPVQSIDLAPTILETVGVDIPGWMDGVAVTSQRNHAARDRLIINYKDPVDRRIYDLPTKLAIRSQPYKMIVSCDTQKVELYDIDRDPGEQTNLASIERLTLKELWERLKRNLDKQRSAQRMICRFNPGS